MPGTTASFGCSPWMTAAAPSFRSPRGLRRMKMSPEFVPLMPPRAPIVEKNASTFGSWATIRLRARWCSFMASKEIPSWASVKEMTWEVSSLGRNPVGTRAARRTVAARTAAEPTFVTHLWRSDQRRLRS